MAAKSTRTLKTKPTRPAQSTKTSKSTNFLVWLPRVLAILFTVFISLFAFDVFDQPLWLLALLIHLIPTYILIAVTAIAWKKPKLGGTLFILAGLALIVLSRGEALILTLPATLIGLLFLVQKPIKSAN